ncbi:MAG: formylmethanofuran dehydrogenase subunit C [Candidatus Symbiobacter sp.]|nr:formylmethanofuran dehydrogenase subunit C [Candidatus Symbiobacter sp.]
MNMILTAKSSSLAQRISLLGITPESLLGLSEAEISHLPIRVGKDFFPMGEIFSLAHHGNDREHPSILIRTNGKKIDHIGAGMSGGKIDIDGDVGAYVGAGMRGGQMTVRGNADYGAAMAMSGGRIDIHGNAANRLAAAKPGALTGLAGGVVVVWGDALGDVGLGMKRGLVVVMGEVVGVACGGMIGGTLVVMGGLATPCGVAMRKGSILALGGFKPAGLAVVDATRPSPSPDLPSFAACLSHDLGIFSLWQREFLALGLPKLSETMEKNQKFHRLMGDRGQNGLGEIFFPEG